MNQAPRNHPERDDSGSSQLPLAVVAIGYAVVAGVLLVGLFVATAVHEITPLVRVVGLGCYGVAAVGAVLQIAVGIGLLHDAEWLGPLVRGTTTAIVVPLILAAAFFRTDLFAAQLNQGMWSLIAAIVGLPWPLYLNFGLKHDK